MYVYRYILLSFRSLSETHQCQRPMFQHVRSFRRKDRIFRKISNGTLELSCQQAAMIAINLAFDQWHHLELDQWHHLGLENPPFQIRFNVVIPFTNDVGQGPSQPSKQQCSSTCYPRDHETSGFAAAIQNEKVQLAPFRCIIHIHISFTRTL